jgi:ADP-dependent NAD(P)H-hydrate dehydratase / NAD(P)H-hydrate epimerase
METFISKELVSSILKPRKKFSHKGDYGYGGLIAGSKGMMGAAVLSTKAFIRSGGGKLTCHVPDPGYDIMQIAVPEAMCKTEPGDDHIISISSLDKYDVLGIGPGLGPYASHKILLEDIFSQFSKPIVIDADALNAIARTKELLNQIPAHSILTPHAGEFERLFGDVSHDIALMNAAKYNVIIVVKGPDTFIALPSGDSYVNTTGNPGMATGGTGDVLTGIITGLLAQQLSPKHAAVAGVYLHGLAGDIAAEHRSQQSLIASDIIEYLGQAFLRIIQHNKRS